MAHKTVLLQESVDALALQPGSVVVDATINGGGHSEEILRRFGSQVQLVGIDLDQDAIDRSKLRLEAMVKEGDLPNFTLHQSSFRNLDKVLAEAGVPAINAILFDLGWSSNQFEESGRGFSFQKDEPLVMTFKKPLDAAQKVEVAALTGKEVLNHYQLTAYEIINEWKEESISDIIFAYGEERYSRRIARQIVEARKAKPIQTTFELVEVIRKAVPFLYTKGKIHFATKTFQALRITVNDEMEALREGLKKGFGHLVSGGRMAVISFHSTEDRIVKRYFVEKEKDGFAKIITKKPMTASTEELAENRRSRSAKLRIIEKI